MDKEQEQNQNFKVVDKRRFSETGESLEGSSNTEKKVSEVKNASADIEENDSAKENNTVDKSDAGRLDFPAFLVGMYSQTLIFLGEIPDPDSNLIAKNLDAAKQNIDIIAILEEKTKGNLLNDEDKLIQEILNNLRLLFVKKL